MDGESIFGAIIMVFSNLICAGSFYGIGIWAEKRKDPMHFYSGTKVDPRTISDIPAYNRENAAMWKQFSVPFFLAAACAVAGLWEKQLSILGIILLVAGSTAGIGWLLVRYNRILKKYQVR